MSKLKKWGNSNDNIHIELDEIEIDGQIKILNNLEINPILNQLRQQVSNMDIDTEEYPAVQNILEIKRWDRESFVKCIRKHVAQFSEGVLASIVANYLTT